MAECTIVNSKTYHLALTEEEALYIKGLVQNSLFTPIEDEPLPLRNTRETIWDALESADRTTPIP